MLQEVFLNFSEIILNLQPYQFVWLEEMNQGS